jgi:hypothetical protein
MKAIRLFFLLLSLLPYSFASAQISHGGVPFFPQRNMLRASAAPFFIEMPAFDLDSVLREDELDQGNLRGSYQFAHKFYTNIGLKKDAALTVLPDGTKIRQIGIRSKSAYSINLLLKNFEIPEGGKLFVYNADYSFIIGSFDYRNNSPGKILPLQPVAGESIIIEYSEPANVEFEGNFTVAEVNHDYRDFLRSEPYTESNADNTTNFTCMPDALCSGADEKTIRSTVLLIINGNVRCTGSLVNNTADNGKPYLLTAVHCLNREGSGGDPIFPQEWGFYDTKAGTIIAFFNYNRPICGTKMKGTEEMSLAITHPRVILENRDIALLEFLETPPAHYNAYYAGWNVETNGGGAPHTNLHHPSAAVKKYGMTSAALTLVTIPGYSGTFEDNTHWKVSSWNTGSTWGGSSGSPLFDSNNLIIGGLTGGTSLCTGTNPNGASDYFFALYKGWESNNVTNQLKTYLNPANKNVKQYPGMDPHKTNPIIRLSNANYSSGDALITSELNSPNSGFVFGNSNLQTLEFAEEFTVSNEKEILGAYLLLPSMTYSHTNGVEISIYSGSTSPTTKQQTQQFNPQFLNYTNGGINGENKTTSVVATESFVLFDKPVKVNNNFFISYKINYSTTSKFCVYNTQFGSSNHPNTAWLKDATKGWVRADAYTPKSMKTALAIQAVMRNSTNNGIKNVDISVENPIYYDRANRILTLRNLENESGRIEIYSIGGQLLEEFYFNSGQTSFILSGKTKGTIGIVKVNGLFSVYAKKIIY